jgi:hypothetical protein
VTTESDRMGDRACIYCGNPGCRYGACQEWHIPGKRFYHEDARCLTCHRPFEMGEQYHQKFVGVASNNTISEVCCAKCAGLPDAGSSAREFDDLAEVSIGFDPPDGPISSLAVGESLSGGDDATHRFSEVPAVSPSARTVLLAIQPEMSWCIWHLVKLLLWPDRTLRRLVDAYNAQTEGTR